MTHDQKINYMRIAAGICGYGFTNKQLDLLVSIYDLVTEKQDETSLKDVVKAECDVKQRDDVKSRQELLDKVSTKTSVT